MWTQVAAFFKVRFYEYAACHHRAKLFLPPSSRWYKLSVLTFVSHVNIWTSFLRFPPFALLCKWLMTHCCCYTASICTFLPSDAVTGGGTSPFHIIYRRMQHMGRRIAADDMCSRATTPSIVYRAAERVGRTPEERERPGKGSASICLHASQWSPARTTWDYAHVQVVTVICIGS